jgi:copper(I)-binding protein
MESPRIWLFASLISLAPAFAQAAETGADAVSVESPYVREVPPVSRTSAAFMTLKNTGTRDHAVVGARSPAAAVVELHTHLLGDDGMHRMREVARIDVPAGGETVLQPGGLHVMLVDLAAPLKAGDQVELTLIYDDASERTLAAEVRTIESTMMMPPN